MGDPGNGDELPEGEVVAAVVGAVSDEPAASAAAARVGGAGEVVQGIRVKREKPCEVSGKHGNGNASACT